MENGDEEKPDEDTGLLQREVEMQISEYFQIEESIRSLLREVRQMQIQGEYAQARDRLRRLAMSKRNAFRFLTYSCNGMEAYFVQVEETVQNEEVHQHMNWLNDQFEDLLPEINAVHLEQFSDRFNPFTGYDSAPSYSHDTGEPMVLYQAKSGDTPILETQITASIALLMARTLIQSATESVENVNNNGLPIADDEIQRLNKLQSQLREEFSDLDGELTEIGGFKDG